MHPHKAEASETSRAKMRAISGRGGGGTGFIGGSPFKRAGADGEQKSYLGHEKVFASPKAAGGAVKRRADKFARGGKVKKAGGGSTGTGRFVRRWDPRAGDPGAENMGTLSDLLRSQDENPQYESFSNQTKIPMGRGNVGEPPGGGPPDEASDVPQSRRGGRIRRAQGGRTMMPYGNEPRRRVAGKSARKGGNVNIAINMPPHLPHPGGGMVPPLPPGGLSGGAGGPPGLPPGGGAPPPAIPPALMGGAMPGGAAGGVPGGPGGMNPAAMQALAGIAGGQGGPMGAGMPGRGPFAKGGAVKSTGLASNLGHWRDYATKNVRGNSAQNRGATGESEELPLRTPDHVKGASDAEVAKRRGGRGEGGKYARGGRARGGKIPVPMTGGSESGVGRKRMAALQPKYR